MSLVNKMLRDLDARRAGEGERAGLPAAVTPLAARQEARGSRSGMVLGGVIIIAGLVAAAWYMTLPGGAGRGDAVQTTAVSAPVPAPVAAAPVAAVAVAAAPVVAATPSEPVPEATVPTPSAGGRSGLPSLRMADELSLKWPSPAPAPERKATKPAAPSKPVAVPPAVEPPVRAVVALPRIPPAPAEGRISKLERVATPVEKAEAEYRLGVQAQRQGSADSAAASYRAALEDYPEHAAARQTLAAMLIEARHFDEAEELLRKGTELVAVRLASVLSLARLKVERNQAPAALELLLKHAAAGERSADYQGFAGALLNRAARAPEAVERYQAATRLAPGDGRWWAGLGIAQEAAGKPAEAREAYQKARSLPGLPADLAAHVEQRLR